MTQTQPLKFQAGAAAAAGDECTGSATQQQVTAPVRPRGGVLRVDLSGCKYELFSRHIAPKLGWQLVAPGSCDWDLCWLDTSVSQERLLRLQPTQRINHFYGMLELARKRPMARTVAALAAAAAAAAAAGTPTACTAPAAPPQPAPLLSTAPTVPAAAAAESQSEGGPVASLQLDFMPQTWALPQQLPAFLAAAQAGGRRAAFIVKPDAGCQGRGIRILMGGPEARVLAALGGPAAVEGAPAVAQAYLADPLLVNGLKFDLRVYCLVTCVEPLRVFLYQEGLVRFCTAPYRRPSSKNSGCSFMHLTNYAVNKHNAAAFVAPTNAAAAAAATGHAAVAGAADRVVSNSTTCCAGSEPVGHASSCCCGSQQCQQQECHAKAETGHQLQGAGAAHAAAGVEGASGGDASKLSFQQLRQHLEGQGADWPKLWAQISQLITQSLIAVTPHLAASYKATVPATPLSTATDASNSSSHNSSQSSGKRGYSLGAPYQRRNSSSSDGCAGYGSRGSSGGRSKGRKGSGPSPAALAAMHGSRCFELLGFDVLIDADLKPWLIEVNHSPSFNIDSPLDRTIKEDLIRDTVTLVRLEPKAIAAAKRAAHKASQARLLTTTHARGGSSGGSGGSTGGSSGGSVAVALEAAQAERSAIQASIDAWQGKHLGGFERAYPLTLPHTQPPESCAHSSSSSSRPTTSSQQREQRRRQEQQRQQWLQYAPKQQELYDQLLSLSRAVYAQQTQQQQLGQGSPTRLQKSPSKLRPQQQQQQQQQQSPVKQQAAAAAGRGGSPSRTVQRSLSQPSGQQQQQEQQRCLQKSLTSPSRLGPPRQPAPDQQRQQECAGALAPLAHLVQQQHSLAEQAAGAAAAAIAAAGGWPPASPQGSGQHCSEELLCREEQLPCGPLSPHRADEALAALRAVLAAPDAQQCCTIGSSSSSSRGGSRGTSGGSRPVSRGYGVCQPGGPSPRTAAPAAGTRPQPQLQQQQAAHSPSRSVSSSRPSTAAAAVAAAAVRLQQQVTLLQEAAEGGQLHGPCRSDTSSSHGCSSGGSKADSSDGSSSGGSTGRSGSVLSAISSVGSRTGQLLLQDKSSSGSTSSCKGCAASDVDRVAVSSRLQQQQQQQQLEAGSVGGSNCAGPQASHCALLRVSGLRQLGRNSTWPGPANSKSSGGQVSGMAGSRGSCVTLCASGNGSSRGAPAAAPLLLQLSRQVVSPARRGQQQQQQWQQQPQRLSVPTGNGSSPCGSTGRAELLGAAGMQTEALPAAESGGSSSSSRREPLRLPQVQHSAGSPARLLLRGSSGGLMGRLDLSQLLGVGSVHHNAAN